MRTNTLGKTAVNHQPSAINRISAIAAMSENRAIGKDNKLLWDLPDDWANFRRVTAGKAFIMGRKSYETEDALVSDYRNIIITSRKKMDLPDNTQIAHSPKEALHLLAGESEIFILGGSSIFEQMMPQCNYMYLTIVHHVFTGDAYFPEINWDQWQLTKSERHEQDDRHTYSFSLNEYRLK